MSAIIKSSSPQTPLPQPEFLCFGCKKKVEKVSECARCHFTQYCGKECQTASWPSHKQVCKFFHQEAEEWKTYNPRQTPNSIWETFDNPHVFPLLPPLFNKLGMGKCAVDLGAGNSESTLFLLKRGWSVIAVDIFQGPLDRLTERANKINENWIKDGQLKIVKQDACTYTFPEEVDLVLAADVFPYLDPYKLGRLLEKIHRALKQEGMLLGSFFQKGSAQKIIFGGWEIDNIHFGELLLQQALFEVLACQFRLKKEDESKVVEFCVGKQQEKPLPPMLQLLLKAPSTEG